MFIKLTRIDSKPIWINASFVVTVEPRREGFGAIVVPMGDGLDYDVRESPEEVLRMLEGVPAPKIVPVPISDCLTKSPEAVKPAPAPAPVPTAEASPAASPAPKPAKRKSRARTKAADEGAKTEPAAAPENPTVTTLSLEDVARLRKLAPKSLAKLKNTLFTQFRLSEVDGAIQSLVERGTIVINATKVVWSAEPPAVA